MEDLNNEMDTSIDKDTEILKVAESTNKPGNEIKHKFTLIILVIILLLTLTFIKSLNAQPNEQPFYNFKRLVEKSQLLMKSTPKDRLNFFLGLLDKRFEELKFIAGNGKSPNILSASLRYSTTAGQITELITQNNMVDEAGSAKLKFEQHLRGIEGIIESYDKNDTEIKFLVDAVNYLKIYIDQLSSLSSSY